MLLPTGARKQAFCKEKGKRKKVKVKRKSASFIFTFALKNDSLISCPARYSLAVEIFQKRYGVFARDSGYLFEGWHINHSLRLVLRGVLAQTSNEIVESHAMEEEIRADSYQQAIVNQQLKNLSRVFARVIRAACARERFIERWRFERGVSVNFLKSGTQRGVRSCKS